MMGVKVECFLLYSRGVWGDFYWQQNHCRSCWSALIQCKEMLKLCVAIMIFLVSLAAEISHPILLDKLNSLVVVLKNQDEDMLHGSGRGQTTCSPAWKSGWNCRFLDFHVSSMIWFNFNNTFGKHRIHENVRTKNSDPTQLHEMFWSHSVTSSCLILLMLSN